MVRADLGEQGHATASVVRASGCAPSYKFEFSTRFLHIGQKHRFLEIVRESGRNGRCAFAYRVPVIGDGDLQNGLRCDVVDEAGNYRCHMPPSLQHETAFSANSLSSTAAIRIEYGILAHVFRKDGNQESTVKRIFQRINVSFPQSPAPPTCVDDFPGEYTCLRRTVLRKRMLQRLGTICIEAREPAAFQFRRDVEDAFSWVPLSISLKPDSPATSLDTFQLEASIIWNLEISTFVAMEKRAKPMVMLEASDSATGARIASLSSPHRLKMVFSSWSRMKSNNWSDSDMSWVAEGVIMLQLPYKPMLAPTFWAPLISRRYSVRLQIALFGFGSAKIELVIPAQIVYDDGIREPQLPTRHDEITF
ncbi:hypothetical protein LTR41_011826 [Exophiala xenobiotica]|nr:hypothetical protein LTR41_011826 [Exophiala xenobiotica]KAK5550345.1 hypothetical protein LTR46_011650 [Exophiala xenobiotica]